ncbi:aminotransferase class I/II-fold pyridoxal phosphate-dependent enzyme [Alphaproteobacteria bacterium]|nr:aminotransferase class I/II-fold pyridoxal phosphate-dependent enzyme [Alphaproteobacteria bacterium]
MTKYMISENMNNLGTENAFVVLARAAELERQGHKVINLGIGQPDFKTADHIVEAAIKALKDGHHGYTPGNGILELRESVAADIHKRHNVEINPDQVVIVPGGKVTMWHCMLMFGGKGKEILYPNPGFPIYESAIKFSGAKPVPIPLLESTNFSFNLEETLSLINNNTSLIIINSPANPTGGLIKKELLDQLVQKLEEFPNVCILSDEIYSHIVYENKFHSMLNYQSILDRLIILDGWSKTYAMTGWRIGYGIWPLQLAEKATRLNINSVSCTNAATQYAAIAALNGPQDQVLNMLNQFKKRRNLIVEKTNLIPGMSSQMPQGAFYTMPNIKKTKLTSREMENLLLEELKIATVAGTSFGQYGEGYIRFSYANSEENINEALSRIHEYAINNNWG